MDWKKIKNLILFPPLSLFFLLLPLSVGILIYTILFLHQSVFLQIEAGTLCIYLLTVLCLRIPTIFAFFRDIHRQTGFARRWLTDIHFRVNFTLTANVIWNSAFSALQLGLGIYHHSIWFYTLAGYYFTLALMRFFLARYTAVYQPGQQMFRELRLYRSCGWMFLLVNLALHSMIYFATQSHTVWHHGLTTIALAIYTVISLTMSIHNVIKYKKYHSPVFSASKAISLAAACVSLLSLEETMLLTVSQGTITPHIKTLVLFLSRLTVSGFVVIMAIYMIVKANLALRHLE